MNRERILVWDWPTRVMHWGLAVSFLGAYLTAESERFRDIHVMLGYTLLALVVCRVAWGFVGTRHARFSSFLYGPRAVARYLVSLLRGRPQHYVGHNPAGSIAIFLMLGVALAAAISGHATYNEWGGDWLEELHEGAAGFMLALVLVHIAGVIVSQVLHRENLVGAMIDGRKLGQPQEGIRRAHAWLAVVLVGGIVALWYPGAGDMLATSVERAAQLAQDGHRAAHHDHDDR